MTKTKTKKKRRSAWGRVYRRPGGKGWLVQFPDPSGRRAPSGRTAYVTRSVLTREEGEALLREVRKAALAGTLGTAEPATPPTDLTVLEAIDEYMGSMRAAGRREGSIKMAGYSRKAIERNGLGRKRVADVTVVDIENYLAWRRNHVWRTSRTKGEPSKAHLVKGAMASSATVGRDRQVLVATFNRLVRMELLTRNVAAKVPQPKKASRQRIALSKEDARKLLDAADRWLRPLIMTLLYTGARKGEALRLRWRDLDFEGRRIALYRPKVGNASTIPMHPALADELAALKRERDPKDTDPVFVSRFGRRLTQFKNGFDATVKRAGLEGRGITPHILRHTFAVHFLERGAAVTDLQAVLGHADLATTQIYAQMVDARTKASVEALDFGK